MECHRSFLDSLEGGSGPAMVASAAFRQRLQVVGPHKLVAAKGRLADLFAAALLRASPGPTRFVCHR